jgi:hypothetical protein
MHILHKRLLWFLTFTSEMILRYKLDKMFRVNPFMVKKNSSAAGQSNSSHSSLSLSLCWPCSNQPKHELFPVSWNTAPCRAVPVYKYTRLHIRDIRKLWSWNFKISAGDNNNTRTTDKPRHSASAVSTSSRSTRSFVSPFNPLFRKHQLISSAFGQWICKVSHFCFPSPGERVYSSCPCRAAFRRHNVTAAVVSLYI